MSFKVKSNQTKSNQKIFFHQIKQFFLEDDSRALIKCIKKDSRTQLFSCEFCEIFHTRPQFKS